MNARHSETGGCAHLQELACHQVPQQKLAVFRGACNPFSVGTEADAGDLLVVARVSLDARLVAHVPHLHGAVHAARHDELAIGVVHDGRNVDLMAAQVARQAALVEVKDLE